MPKPGIVQHEESFEVVKADGSVEFVYFDENPGRRVINGRLSKEAAFARAQELLKVRGRSAFASIPLPERPAVIVPAEPWAARAARCARTDMPPVLSNAARTYRPVYL